MTILNSLTRVLNKPKKTNSTNPVASVQLSDPKKTTNRRKIFLNGIANDSTEDPHIELICPAGSSAQNEVVVRKFKSDSTIAINTEGSYIVRNEAGTIIQTSDVLRMKREFSYDSETGDLLVKQFAIWSKLQNARLNEAGTLFYTNNDVDIEERLNGLHIQRNRESRLMIQIHHHNRFELVRLANGEIWKRQTTDDQETFAIWTHGKLRFKSTTFFLPGRALPKTVNGLQPMLHVSRLEESWNNGMLTREKYTFNNVNTQARAVTIPIHFNTGMFNLKNVTSVITTFANGHPTETVYELKEPIDIRIDMPSVCRTLPNISRIRNFARGLQQGLAFESQTGADYIVFLNGRQADSVRQSKTVAAERELANDLGEQVADFILR